MELTHNLPGPGQVDVPILLQHVTRVLLQAGVVIDTCSPDLVTRVDIGGSYGEHQCGIVLHNISREEAGNWTCEVKMFCTMYCVFDLVQKTKQIIFWRMYWLKDERTLGILKKYLYTNVYKCHLWYFSKSIFYVHCMIRWRNISLVIGCLALEKLQH